MHLQTQSNTQVFTIFGTYGFEQHGDYSPLNNGRSDIQDRCDTGKMEWADVLRKLRATVSSINPR
jgi:hypothetical protein